MRIGLVLAAATLIVAASLSSATASSMTATTRAPGLEVVASGLDSPRGIAFGHSGVMYVAEAGRGGEGPCTVGPDGAEFCVGPTGAVTAVRDGHQRRVVTGLPSFGNRSGTFVLGPHDVGVLWAGFLRVTIGLGLDPRNRGTLGAPGAALGQLVTVFPWGGWCPTADIAAYELANNPDQGVPGALVESDAYGLLQEGARTYVADAAGNSLLLVDEVGRISTVAVFPDLPDPETGDMLDAVPTAVVRGPDGALYVGQLTGFPWPPGRANVFRVVPGQPPAAHAAGFTNIIDLAHDAQGRLLVLEIATNGLASGDATGALKRIEPDGTVTTLVSAGLTAPTSVAFGPDGAIYIANKGRSVGIGEVLRVRP